MKGISFWKFLLFTRRTPRKIKPSRILGTSSLHKLKEHPLSRTLGKVWSRLTPLNLGIFLNFQNYPPFINGLCFIAQHIYWDPFVGFIMTDI